MKSGYLELRFSVYTQQQQNLGQSFGQENILKPPSLPSRLGSWLLPLYGGGSVVVDSLFIVAPIFRGGGVGVFGPFL